MHKRTFFRRRTNEWMSLVCWVLLCPVVSLAAEEADVLFIGNSGNHVASGLRALKVPFREVTASGLIKGDACIFDYRVLICGMDVRRWYFLGKGAASAVPLTFCPPLRRRLRSRLERRDWCHNDNVVSP